VRHPHLSATLIAAVLIPTLALAGEPRRGYTLVPGPDGAECKLKVGPGDRLAQDGDLVVPAGAHVEAALALRGRVVIEPGASAVKAVAAGGPVVVRGTVEKEAVSLGDDVQIERGGRVGGDAVSLGGQVRILAGGKVGGDVTSLSLRLLGVDLAQRILDGLATFGPCRVEVDKDAAGTVKIEGPKAGSTR
jgi:hypothetical protein